MSETRISYNYIRLIDAIAQEAMEPESSLHKELKARKLFEKIGMDEEQLHLDKSISTGTLEDYIRSLENELRYLSDTVRKMDALLCVLTDENSKRGFYPMTSPEPSIERVKDD